METVCVLMSTYNGEKYLQEQIESILNQVGVKIELFIRDDGSTDTTCLILDEYKDKNKIDYFCGENKGYVQSFMALMKNAPKSNFYAFADQDDIWDEDKIWVAISKIKDYKKPALYCSNTRLVNELKEFMGNEDKKPKVTLGASLMKNFATGCTMVFNEELLQRVCAHRPSYVSSHDSWVCRVCLAIGGIVVFDDVPHISYRQHSDNVVGSATSVYSKYRKRLFKILNDKSHLRKRNAEELISCYKDEISSSDQELLKMLRDYDKKIYNTFKVIFERRFTCGLKLDDILFRMAILLRWI